MLVVMISPWGDPERLSIADDSEGSPPALSSELDSSATTADLEWYALTFERFVQFAVARYVLVMPLTALDFADRWLRLGGDIGLEEEEYGVKGFGDIGSMGDSIRARLPGRAGSGGSLDGRSSFSLG